MNSIIYIISIILLFLLFCFLKKENLKKDFVPTAIITFLTILTYQFLVCYLFSLLHISITLISISISNIIINVILIILLKKKGIQEFSFSKKDIILTILIIAIVCIISYKDVGFLENIRYYSTDASIHYIAAREFYENDKMLDKTEKTETPKQMMPMAYVNVGMLFKAFAPIVGEINLYKIFILFDITIFCFSALLFYFIIKDKIQSSWHFLFACTISIIYLIGYPLNNLLNGFYYLGIGCLFINAILYVMKYQDEKIIIFLLNTGLILSYSLFAPVVFISIFAYKLYKNYKNNKKILNKKVILDILITLVLPRLNRCYIFNIAKHKSSRRYSSKWIYL